MKASLTGSFIRLTINKYIDIISTKVLVVAPYFNRREWYAFAKVYFVVCQGYILYLSKIDDKLCLEYVL